MKIFLDDERQLGKIYPNLETHYGWKIVRNYNEFVAEVEREFPSFVSFDHDLAEEHYDMAAMKSHEAYTELRKTFKEKTGLECAKWLVEYCMTHNLVFPDYNVHSFNPVGRENIQSYIECFKKFRRENPTS